MALELCTNCDSSSCHQSSCQTLIKRPFESMIGATLSTSVYLAKTRGVALAIKLRTFCTGAYVSTNRQPPRSQFVTSLESVAVRIPQEPSDGQAITLLRCLAPAFACRSRSGLTHPAWCLCKRHTFPVWQCGLTLVSLNSSPRNRPRKGCSVGCYRLFRYPANRSDRQSDNRDDAFDESSSRTETCAI